MKVQPASSVPSLYQLLPSSSIPLPSYALPLSHRDSQTTNHLANLVNTGTATSILHAYLHSLDLPPPNVTGTHRPARKPRKRARLSETESRSELGSDTEGNTTRANADAEDSELGRDRTKPRKKGRPSGAQQPRKMPRVKVEGVDLGKSE